MSASTLAILRAARYAAEKHADQRRKGVRKEPYINHPLEVAELVASALTAPDENLVIAALLHDVVEDTDTTFDELARLFGSDVAALVAEVTDDSSLPRLERKRLQIATAPDKSPRAQVIRLADKISNLRSIRDSAPADWDERRKREYFDWGRTVVAGLSAPNPHLKREFDQLVRDFEATLAARQPQ